LRGTLAAISPVSDCLDPSACSLGPAIVQQWGSKVVSVTKWRPGDAPTGGLRRFGGVRSLFRVAVEADAMLSSFWTERAEKRYLSRLD
jgi:hypothetical protein